MYKEEVIYKSDYAEILKFRDRVRELSLKYKFFDIYVENIELSIGELFTNIIKHGQKNESVKSDIKAIIVIDNDKIEISFEYQGDIPTLERLNEVMKIEETLEVEELSESGRGIFIINELMDKFYYSKLSSYSKATMIKFL